MARSCRTFAVFSTLRLPVTSTLPELAALAVHDEQVAHTERFRFQEIRVLEFVLERARFCSSLVALRNLAKIDVSPRKRRCDLKHKATL